MIKIKKLIRVFLLLTVTIVALPASAAYFYCPEQLTCDLNVGGYASCDNTPSGWVTGLFAYTQDIAPLPAYQVPLYFISAQNYGGDRPPQSTCNYYFITDQGGWYNVTMSLNTGEKMPAAAEKGNWKIYSMPGITYYGCYSGANNTPTTPSDPSQCPFLEGQT